MKAVALVPLAVMNSTIKPMLEYECARNRIKLEFHCVTHSCKEYARLVRENRNVIAWNCRMTHRWMTQFKNNILYIENSILKQQTGAFVDHRGFFDNSNLCRRQDWRRDYPVDLGAFTKRNFGWSPFEGGNPDGPVLVCLQNKADCNLRQQFPASGAEEDKVAAFLEMLQRHLPMGRRVVIRPNPRFLDFWKDGSYTIRGDWEVDWSGDFYQVIKGCSALITVNSSTASEAATLGVPVATLGTGAFTGSGATFECGDDPSRLSNFYNWKPDYDSVTRYAKAILGGHYLSYRDPDIQNHELRSWIEAAF